MDDIKFTEQDDVIELNDSSFDPNGKLKSGHQGLVMAYAPWCGACKAKFDDIKTLSSMVNVDSNYPVSFYVIDASTNEDFRKNNGLSFFPSFYEVSKDGTLTQRNDIQLDNEINDVVNLD